MTEAYHANSTGGASCNDDGAAAALGIVMVSLLLHGYASGLYSSRRIARACCERKDFVMIVALDPPDLRTISDFRKRHLKALGEFSERPVFAARCGAQDRENRLPNRLDRRPGGPAA